MQKKAGLQQSLLFLFSFLLTGGLLADFRAGAVGNIIECYGDPLKWHQNAYDNFHRNHDDVIAAYNLGISFLCLDNIPEGIEHIKLASQKGHIQATYLMALFYETDKTFDHRHQVTDAHLDDAISYYKIAAEQMKAAEEYPYGIHEDMSALEHRHHTRSQVAARLPCMYFNKYSQEIDGLPRQEYLHPPHGVRRSHTIQSLLEMKTFADECLAQAFPPPWLTGEVQVRQAQQTQCQAMSNFANQALYLEMQRLQTAQKCTGLLKNCRPYQKVMHQLVGLFHTMQHQVYSVY